MKEMDSPTVRILALLVVGSVAKALFAPRYTDLQPVVNQVGATVRDAVKSAVKQ